jgi:hypothetical protein
VIAKRRVDIVTGNINSYARVLNGPHQLDKIQTYNELAATMTVLKQEKEKQQIEQREKKKQDDKEKAERKAEKESAAIAKAAELEPICKAHVERGIGHVLTLKVPERRNIIRYHFGLVSFDIDGVTKQVYKMNLAETETALRLLMPQLPQLPINDVGVGSNGDNDLGMDSNGNVGGNGGVVGDNVTVAGV